MISEQAAQRGPSTPRGRPRSGRTDRAAQHLGPVQRAEAPAYLTLLAVAFGVTVILTRVYLALTGYPQIGNATLHIAHALWGGLLLAIAVGIVLQFSNVRLLPRAALLGGIGSGLFIDEVGKFITQRNDYFFPAAAPLIYLTILAALAVAHRAARRRPLSDRERMYRVLSRLEPDLDGRLSPHQRHDLLDDLGLVMRHSERPDLSDLAAALQRHLVSPVVRLTEPAPGRWTRAGLRLERAETRWLPRQRLRWVVIGLTGLLGVASVGQFGLLLALLTDPEGTRDRLRLLVTNASIAGWRSLLILGVVLLFTVLVGVLLLHCALALLLHRHEARAVRLGGLALVFALTAVNVLASYFDVERVVFLCLLQLTALGAVYRYRQRFLTPAVETPGQRGALATAGRPSATATPPDREQEATG